MKQRNSVKSVRFGPLDSGSKAWRLLSEPASAALVLSSYLKKIVQSFVNHAPPLRYTQASAMNGSADGTGGWRIIVERGGSCRRQTLPDASNDMMVT